MNFDMIGPAIVLGLGMMGSAIGCGLAGMAAVGVMSRMEEGHGRFIMMAAIPSSQGIVAFVLMFLMAIKIRAATLAPINGIAIGLFAGLAIFMSAIYQGMCAASGIHAVAKQPSIFGKSLAILAIVETFALFALAFSLLLI